MRLRKEMNDITAYQGSHADHLIGIIERTTLTRNLEGY